MESPVLIRRLFMLYLGTPEDSSLPSNEHIPPAAPGIQTRILTLFPKSLAAANHFPETYQV